MSELSREYLEAALERVRDYVPDWLWQEIHRGAFPSAGGRARHRPLPMPNELEKLALREIRPRTLARIDDQELLQTWHRLNQWYGAAKRNSKAIEDLVNAAHWVMAEAEKRGISIDMKGELAQEAAQLAKSLPGRLGQLWGLMPHEDVMVVPDFVSVVGGAVKNVDADDVDVLIRAAQVGDTYPINAHSVDLPIRNLLDPGKSGYLHYIASPQGPHADYVPLYDLVLRARANAEVKLVKARPEPDEKIVKGAGATGGLMFVGSRPTVLEAVRGVPLAGPDGATFRDRYLGPLRLSREQVYVTNLVPLPLGRMPTDEEIALWRDHLQAEMSAVKPVAIVALGKQAAEALGDDACLFLPHPNAVRRMGDSGEVRRKLARLQSILAQKAALGEEGGQQAATQEWVRTWHKRFPPSGKGRFVYQHHWRGLDEEESKLSEKALLATDHSVHGDLRMTAADGELWGVSVFLGKTADNRARDRLLGLRQSQDNLQFAHKPPQPTAWLKVGVGKPYISPPGGVGSASRTWAMFNALDSGSYRVGVWRDHMVELFFEGKHLKGRYLLQYAPVGARGRLWIVDAPENQTPYAETHKLENILAELKQKRQRWLLWSDGKSTPELYDVKGGKPVSKTEVYIDFAKADDERQIVYGVVSEPEVEDTQGDSANAEEIELAAHQYLTMSRVVGMEHRKVARAQVVESYLAPTDFDLGDERVRKGSWVLAVHVEDSGDWARVKSGELSGFSLGGYGVRSDA